MKKELSNKTTMEFPATSLTSFKVEGYQGYYTIIDVVTLKCKDTYALLEHNVQGEDNMLVVKLPNTTNPLILKRYNGSKYDTDLLEPTDHAIYIPERNIIAEAYDNVIITLEDNDIDAVNAEIWTDEEINDELFEEAINFFKKYIDYDYIANSNAETLKEFAREQAKGKLISHGLSTFINRNIEGIIARFIYDYE